MEIDKLARKNILELTPYSSARDEYKGRSAYFMDANENPYNFPYNRYPDPGQVSLKKSVASLKEIDSEQLFLGNGSDEAIDLLIRIFCEPGKDNLITIDPTYGMYAVCAEINDIKVKKASLDTAFNLDVNAIKKELDKQTKMIFICSPNNPTANSFKEEDVISLLESVNIPVVIDEAYIDFSQNEGYLKFLDKYTNLIVLQTFSKAWGMAGIRLGMAMADKRVIDLMNKVKYPYNVNQVTQGIVQRALKKPEKKSRWVKKILQQRDWLMQKMEGFDFIEKVYPSDANFFLIKVEKPIELYNYLAGSKVIVRDRSKVHLCKGCLRITVGNKKENRMLLKLLKKR